MKYFFSISVSFSHFIMIRISQNKNMYIYAYAYNHNDLMFFFKSSSSLDLGIEDYREENIISSQNSRRILCSLSFSIFLADASDFIFLEH